MPRLNKFTLTGQEKYKIHRNAEAAGAGNRAE